MLMAARQDESEKLDLVYQALRRCRLRLLGGISSFFDSRVAKFHLIEYCIQ
jgi:hypothetical protein